MFAVNVIGLLLCCREATKRIDAHGGKGGSIVNVSSMAATIGGRPASAAATGAVGVRRFMGWLPRSARQCSSPGVTDTDD
jgi:NAD(P)-dependent dehydrogenase (short-subunit alcohol dehydrogenase family)